MEEKDEAGGLNKTCGRSFLQWGNSTSIIRLLINKVFFMHQMLTETNAVLMHIWKMAASTLHKFK